MDSKQKGRDHSFISTCEKWAPPPPLCL
jgi:hypothetical protein